MQKDENLPLKFPTACKSGISSLPFQDCITIQIGNVYIGIHGFVWIYNFNINSHILQSVTSLSLVWRGSREIKISALLRSIFIPLFPPLRKQNPKQMNVIIQPVYTCCNHLTVWKHGATNVVGQSLSSHYWSICILSKDLVTMKLLVCLLLIKISSPTRVKPKPVFVASL